MAPQMLSLLRFIEQHVFGNVVFTLSISVSPCFICIARYVAMNIPKLVLSVVDHNYREQGQRHWQWKADEIL